MQKRSLALIVGGAAISMAAASVTQGAVTVSATNLGPAQNSSGSIAAQGHSAWLLTLTSDSGKITGIDLGKDADAVEGIFASMGQRWSDDGEGGVTPTAASSVRNNDTTFSLDSHFLVTANRVDVFAFSEDNDLAARPGYPADTATVNYGNGTELHGVIGLLPAGQATSIDLAYVVIPDNALGRLTVNVATEQGEFTGVPGAFGIPEPTTLSLVGLAGLGMVARRRKI